MFAAVAIFAARRGEAFFRALGEGNWIAWTIVIACIVGWIVKLAGSREAKSEPAYVAAKPDSAACPHCHESVRADATFCRHCKHWIE